MNEMIATLVFLVNSDQVLLAMKKRGFGEGKYNGVGGKVEPGESIQDAAIRETQEEIDVTITSCQKAAVLYFDEFFKGEPTLFIVHVFVATKWQGKPTESEEMKPEWFNISELPLNKMWRDDPYWLPRVLEGQKLIAKFKLDINDEIVNHKVTTVKGF
jgi:8-oxo-dGTP diphosphatase / 2-hydroxy-dATP diphosphatase